MANFMSCVFYFSTVRKDRKKLNGRTAEEAQRKQIREEQKETLRVMCLKIFKETMA